MGSKKCPKGTTTDIPTLYEHYTTGGITSGLTCDGRKFRLNKKDIWIHSGSVHYFRVPKKYWRDRLRKLRACGLIAVATCVPWNLHEHQKGKWDFGLGGSDMEDFLCLRGFLETAREEDLFVIVRPGPCICGQWEFGGLPSWLLREDVELRRNHQGFLGFVERYFRKLFEVLGDLQFTKGGPVIAFQIENEYGSTKIDDEEYLEKLKAIMEQAGLVEMFFTMDSVYCVKNRGSIPGVLITTSFQNSPTHELDALAELQPDKPLFVTENWTGWYDHWSELHHIRSPERFVKIVETILKYPASFNLYMFHGGTSWGFLNGADFSKEAGYQPVVTSYDYDAPLTENGEYTEKYWLLRDLLLRHNKLVIKLPERPEAIAPHRYPDQKISEIITLPQILPQLEKLLSEQPLPMELLDINNDSGQSYGYVVYRKTNLDIPPNSRLKISGKIHDTILVVLNGSLLDPKPPTRRQKDFLLPLPETKDATLELIVENCGRPTFTTLDQPLPKKGLTGPISINDTKITRWEIYPLEFTKKWNKSLYGWRSFCACSPRPKTLAIYKTFLDVNEPKDGFIDMRDWVKGIVIVNGFVLGRYAAIGPQLTLYLPAPLLKKGTNEILVFEHYRSAKKIAFSPGPINTGTTVKLPC